MPSARGMPASTLFAFAWDLDDEGPEVVLDRVAASGLGGITVATTYHACHDLLPHNPRRRQAISSTGGLLFPPDPKRWEGSPIGPRPHTLQPATGVLERTRVSAKQRGLIVDAWTVFAHVDRPDLAERGFTRVDAWGSRVDTDLCLANPAFASYVNALTADTASRGVASIQAESLHWMGFGHGAHHERCFSPVGQLGRFLLGLCFCPSCIEGCGVRGIDASRIAAVVRTCFDDLAFGKVAFGKVAFGKVAFGKVAFAGNMAFDANVVRLDDVAGLADGDMAAFLDFRTAAVTSAVQTFVAAADEAGVDVWFLDSIGAELGYATGMPSGPPAAELGWMFGCDLTEIAATGAGIAMLAYAKDPERVASDAAAYRALLPSARLGAVLRPMPPDCADGPNLADKVGALRHVDVERVDYYHYGLAPLGALDHVRHALTTDRLAT